MLCIADVISAGWEKDRAMVDVAAVLMGLISAGIFVAHAVDAYQEH
jgi:hypothetical protein